MSEAGPLLPSFYAGRTVFITGGTGFIGKMLVERLLWTCPDIAEVILLVRDKKDESPARRLERLKQSEVFSCVRSACPSQLDKVRVLAGDTGLPLLGLQPADILLLHHVSVVFHNAATLRFEEPLPEALTQNVTALTQLLHICDRLPDVQALVHVSTAYSNADLTTVEERVYEAPVSLAHVLALADSLPQQLLPDVTPRLIHPKPNTYTFTKALAESVLQQRTSRRYPVAIFRPTVVISSDRYPFPGWIENLNGPSGVIVGVGKGMMHVFKGNLDIHLDVIPVDVVVDNMIAVGWETAQESSESVRVYNCASCGHSTPLRQFRDAMFRGLKEFPLDGALSYPWTVSVDNRCMYTLLEFILQTAPLYVAEQLRRMYGGKARLSFITAGHRLRAMNDVLEFFVSREWMFPTDNLRRLRQRLTERDTHMYNLDVANVNWDDLYLNFVKGTRKYLLKENDEGLKYARQRMKSLRMIHYACILFLLVLLCRLIVFAVNYFS